VQQRPRAPPQLFACHLLAERRLPIVHRMTRNVSVSCVMVAYMWVARESVRWLGSGCSRDRKARKGGIRARTHPSERRGCCGRSGGGAGADASVHEGARRGRVV
jgi:hypothetical protein